MPDSIFHAKHIQKIIFYLLYQKPTHISMNFSTFPQSDKKTAQMTGALAYMPQAAAGACAGKRKLRRPSERRRNRNRAKRSSEHDRAETHGTGLREAAARAGVANILRSLAGTRGRLSGSGVLPRTLRFCTQDTEKMRTSQVLTPHFPRNVRALPAPFPPCCRCLHPVRRQSPSEGGIL